MQGIINGQAHISHGKGYDSRAATKSTLLDSLLLLLGQNLIIQVLETGLEAHCNAVPAVRTFQALTALWGL